MQCIECSEKMTGVGGFDDPPAGFAFNLRLCDYCGTVAKEDVWNNGGVLWINVNGTIKKIPKKDD